MIWGRYRNKLVNGRHKFPVECSVQPEIFGVRMKIFPVSFQNEDRSKVFAGHPKFQVGISLLHSHVWLSLLINPVSFFCQKSISFSVNLLINSPLSYNYNRHCDPSYDDKGDRILASV